MSDWVTFFDSDNAIYVNARHRAVHARLIADGILRYVDAPDLVLLDFGCGEAGYGERLASRLGRLILCEAAPNLRATLAARFAANLNISVISPDEAAAMPEGTLDFIVMHSVAQYIPPAEMDRLFAQFRRLLRPQGKFVLGDVIPPNVSALKDTAALLKLATREKFLDAALRGLVKTSLSDYRRLRSNKGLTRYDENVMLGKLAAAGFGAAREPENIGHNQTRMTFLARPQRSG